MGHTEVRRIEIIGGIDLGKAIRDLSDSMWVGGYRLASTFLEGRSLVLIYQSRAG